MNLSAKRILVYLTLLYSLNLVAQPVIVVNPDSVNYGNVPVNQDSSAFVNVSNSGSTDLVVSSFQIRGNNASQFSLVNPPALPLTISPNDPPVSLEVRFLPTFAGEKSAVFKIINNDTTQDTVDVALSGIGIGPQIEVDPDTLRFGRITVNRDSVLNLRVFNSGNSTLVVDDTAFVGDHDTLFSFAQTPNLPISLFPGDSTSLSIRFLPTSLGLKRAFLVLTNNDPNQDPFNVSLRGTGVLPDIAASDSSLEFGEVLVGTDSLASLQISNEGTGTLNVTDADIVGPQNDQYSLPNFQPFSIPPGGNPVPISVQFSPTSMGIKNAFLIITHNDENENPLQIPLSGRGIRPIISVNPQELEFGDVSVNSDSLLSIDIKNEGDADLVINDTSLIGINADQFAVVNLPQLPFTIPVGNDSVVITIRFSPTATGIKTAQLRIFNNDPFQNPFPVLMNGRGVLPDISLSPDTLHFGDVNVGNASIRTTFISNVGTSDLIVTDTSLIGIDADLFSVLEMPELPITLAPNTEPVPITIRFNPDSLGMKVARFQIFSNDPDENPVNLELTGTGVQPGIAVNPTQLDFGNVRVNRDSLLTLEVINDGTADLIVIDTAIVGSDPDLFSITTLPDLPFVIEPGGEPEKFTLRFSPDSLGAASAILHITSNDPNMEVLETPLQGNGVQPDIAASVDSLNFGQVLVASDSIIFFQLKNVGGSRLRVDNLAIAGTDTALFTIDSIPDLPFHIQPGDSVLTSLRFSPDTVGSKFAQLQIFSDDPDEFLYAIPLTGSGVAPEIVVDRDSLDFGFVKLNTDSIMSIRITNTGTAPLRVYDLGFGGRPPVPFFIANAPQLPFTVDALDDTVEILIGFSPRLQSKVFNVLYIISNDPYNPQQSLLLSAEGVRGPVIEDISLSEVRLRQDLTVTTTVSADTTIQSVRVKYAANNTNLFSTPIILTPQNGDVYSGTIAGENVSELGLKLALIVTDAYPTRSTDTLYAEVIIPEDAVTHTFNDTLLNRWQMFSVPYNLSDASIGTVLEELGEEGDFSWRIYRTDSSGVSSNYFDSQQLQTMGTYGRFEPGNSFWLYLRDDEDGQVPTNTLSFPQMQTVPGDSFSYTVQPGWNQIGLPYSFTMSWNQVESSEKDSLQIYRWNGRAWSEPLSKLGWTPLVSTNFSLQPWEGYAVHNNSNMPMELIFLPQKTDTSSGILPRLSGTKQKNWQVLLITENEKYFDVNIAGMNVNASEGKDYLDYPDPPLVDGEHLSLFFHHPEWEQPATNYSSDFRPLKKEGEIWYFTIQSSRSQLDLQVKGMESLPENFRLLVFDTKYRRKYYPVSGQKILLKDINSGEENRFAMLIGNDQFLEEELESVPLYQPDENRLIANYPNPFNPETFIRFQITTASRVTLKIYNLLGQEVKTLVNEFKEKGFYEVRWDGTDNSGTELASGLYFYQLRAGDYVKTLKMVKLK